MDVFPVFVNQLVILGCQSNPQAQAYWQDASEIPRPPTVWDDVGKPYKQWDSCHINWWVYRISANHQTTPGLGLHVFHGHSKPWKAQNVPGLGGRTCRATLVRATWRAAQRTARPRRVLENTDTRREKKQVNWVKTWVTIPQTNIFALEKWWGKEDNPFLLFRCEVLSFGR